MLAESLLFEQIQVSHWSRLVGVLQSYSKFTISYRINSFQFAHHTIDKGLRFPKNRPILLVCCSHWWWVLYNPLLSLDLSWKKPSFSCPLLAQLVHPTHPVAIHFSVIHFNFDAPPPFIPFTEPRKLPQFSRNSFCFQISVINPSPLQNQIIMHTSFD